MNALQIVMGALMIVASIAIVIIVLFQQGRSEGLSGTIAGGAESFLGKNKSRSIESKLVRITKVLAIIFFVISIATVIILLFYQKMA